MRDSRPRGLRGILAAAAVLLAQAAPSTQTAVRYGRSERKRAQWKNETNKRGRNR